MARAAWRAASETGTHHSPGSITAAIGYAGYATAKADTEYDALNTMISGSPVSIARTAREPKGAQNRGIAGIFFLRSARQAFRLPKATRLNHFNRLLSGYGFRCATK
jgi:hypothetical protein